MKKISLLLTPILIIFTIIISSCSDDKNENDFFVLKNYSNYTWSNVSITLCSNIECQGGEATLYDEVKHEDILYIPVDFPYYSVSGSTEKGNFLIEPMPTIRNNVVVITPEILLYYIE